MTTDFYDVVIVGGGLMGCFCARNIRRYNLSCAVIEKNEDVCMEISKANTAVVYPGYDNRPGSLKAQMCVESNKKFPALCEELGVKYSRCGSLMTAYGPEGEAILKKKMRHGLDNGIEGLKLLNGDQTRKIEPEVSRDVLCALYCPTTGTVNPWELGIAAYENSLENGVKYYFGEEAESFSDDGIIKLKSGREIFCKIMIDASGINAGKLTDSNYYIEPDAADYLVIDKDSKHLPKTIIFEQSEIKCRGITAVPTTDGTLLIGPTHREITEINATTQNGVFEVKNTAKKVLPNIEMNIIRTFASVRPNIESKTCEDIHDFVIEEKEKSISLIGIKTPGLTCAESIGKYVADLCRNKTGADKNLSFISSRKRQIKMSELSAEKQNEIIKENPDYGKIICLCEKISLGEIKDAVSRGAKSVESVKHRCGATMGKCQGSRCTQRILKILKEENHARV